MLQGLLKIAALHGGDFRMTATQNLIIAEVEADKKDAIESLARENGLLRDVSRLRENSMACVALPTCTLAMAEAERYLPDLITKLETLANKHGLAEQPITIRMTGCPNGCARPYLAEIAFVGKAPGKYNLYLGATEKALALFNSIEKISMKIRFLPKSIPYSNATPQNENQRKALATF